MSSLSAGTLNLKFMQRAAARNAAASPAKPTSASPAATPGAPSAPSAPGTPAPAPAASTAAEEEGKWVLPRRAHAGPSRQPSVQVSFVSSYLPFMEAPEVGMGGGRRAFGGFGEKEEEVKESDEEEIEAVLRSDGEMEEVVATRKESREKGREKGKKKEESMSAPVPEQKPRAFQRPAGFDSPRTGDKLRATIAGMKAVSVSPTPTPGGSGASTPTAGKKRAHPAGEDGAAKRAKNAKSAPNAKNATKATNAPSTLDEREKALKAAKKKEKKKNKGKK